MSRIGKMPVAIPKGVEVNRDGNVLRVKGPKGELSNRIPPGLTVSIDAGEVRIARSGDEPRERAFHGLLRSLVANSVQGVTKGFSKDLEIVGVGYRVQAKGSGVEFSLGYSHSVPVTPPDGVTLRVETPTRLVVEGIDKQQVGEVAANIRKLRKPDPYKGKGVRYAGEQIRRKVGKAGK